MARAAGQDEWNIQIKVNPIQVRDLLGHPVLVLTVVAGKHARLAWLDRLRATILIHDGFTFRKQWNTFRPSVRELKVPLRNYAQSSRSVGN